MLLGLLLLGILLIFSQRDRKLLVMDADTREIYGAYSVETDEVFFLEFVHSVNQTPVIDEFRVTEEGFDAYRTIYSSLGAGVQTELREGETLTYDEDGNMVIAGFDLHYKELNLMVGTVSDHVLTLQGQRISLRDLCGRNASVVLKIR